MDKVRLPSRKRRFTLPIRSSSLKENKLFCSIFTLHKRSIFPHGIRSTFLKRKIFPQEKIFPSRNIRSTFPKIGRRFFPRVIRFTFPEGNLFVFSQMIYVRLSPSKIYKLYFFQATYVRLFPEKIRLSFLKQNTFQFPRKAVRSSFPQLNTFQFF